MNSFLNLLLAVSFPIGLVIFFLMIYWVRTWETQPAPSKGITPVYLTYPKAKAMLTQDLADDGIDVIEISLMPERTLGDVEQFHINGQVYLNRYQLLVKFRHPDGFVCHTTCTIWSEGAEIEWHRSPKELLAEPWLRQPPHLNGI